MNSGIATIPVLLRAVKAIKACALFQPPSFQLTAQGDRRRCPTFWCWTSKWVTPSVAGRLADPNLPASGLRRQPDRFAYVVVVRVCSCAP